MSDNSKPKTKIFRNPARNDGASIKPYVPQYQVHGVEPKEYHSSVVSPDTKIAVPEPLPLDNPRGRKSFYVADTAPVPMGKNLGQVPNVGNNMEHSWSSLDGQIVDDLTNENIDPNHPMIDNNDEMTPEALGFQSGPTAAHLMPPNQMRPPIMVETQDNTQHNVSGNDDLLSILSDLSEDSYLLLASGVPICSGPKAEIEDQARALVFGEHEICDGNPLSPEEVVVLRRVKIKMGLFLE